MARYRDSVCKLCRRENQKLFLKGMRCYSDKCSVSKHPYGPGQHGKKPGRTSEYKVQLREKQKTKRFYGVLEKQFRIYYREAAKRKGITGENLLAILEQRLDNVVYRAGFAMSRAEARQLVRNGFFTVNGTRVNIPSFRVAKNDRIALSSQGDKVQIIKLAAETTQAGIPAWMDVDKKAITAAILNVPSRDQIDLPVQEQLIVELYSK